MKNFKIYYLNIFFFLTVFQLFSALESYHPTERYHRLSYSLQEAFTKAVQANTISDFFAFDESKKISELNTKYLFIQDKFGKDITISAFLYALTAENWKAGIKLLESNHKHAFIPYKKQTPLTIAQEKKAPDYIIDALKKILEAHPVATEPRPHEPPPQSLDILDLSDDEEDATLL